MMYKLFRPFVFMLMLLIFVGSAGWMYTAHFCQMNQECMVMEEGSCCGGMEGECAMGTADFPDSEPAVTPADQACCVNVNLYYNFPVYPIDRIAIPSGKGIMTHAHLFASSAEDVNSISFLKIRDPYPHHFLTEEGALWLKCCVLRV